jgi:hypothetical protein
LVPGGNFRFHAELMGAANFKPCPVLFSPWSERAAPALFPQTPAQTVRSDMRIRYELLVASTMAFTLCLALPAEAAKKKKPRSPAAAAYSTSYASGGPGSWGTANTGPLYNGPDYLGQDPDIHIRAMILKDLSGRYGGTF